MNVMLHDFPLVSIIIPTFNRKMILAREIESIYAGKYPKNRLEVIVVDDASSDGTSELIREKYPIVTVIRNTEERGLAASRNIGLKACRGNFAFVIDDDNIIGEDTIETLVEVFEKNNYGIVGPLMYYYKAPGRIWFASAERNYRTSITRFPYRDQIIGNHDSIPSILETADIPNAFMIKRDVIENVGFFDEKNFPIHYDEADFGERVRRHGYKIVVSTKAKVWHDMPLPEEVEDKARLFHCQNEFRAFHCGRNRMIFHKMYSKPLDYLVFVSLFNWIIAAYYAKVILSSKSRPLSNRFRLVAAYFRGIISAIK